MTTKSINNHSEISLQGVDDTSAFQSDHNEPFLDSELGQNSSPAKTLMGKVIYMGSCFLLLNTANNCQNLLSQIYEQLGYNSLGTTILLLQSLFFVIGVLTVPGVIKNWEYKKGINIGVLGYIIVLAAGAMTTACGVNKDLMWCQQSLYIYGSNVLFALIHGITSPMLFLSAIRYVNACATKEEKGKVSGVFLALYSAFLVLGGIVSKATISRFGSFGYYLISAGLACLSWVMFMAAPHVEKTKEEDADEKPIEKTKKILKLIIGPRMRVLLPYMLYLGFLNAMVAAFQYRLVRNTDSTMTPHELNEISATVNLVQGVLSILASVIAGKLADMLKRRTSLNLFNLIHVIAVGLGFLSYFGKSLFLVYLVAILWGVGIFGGNTVMAALMAKDFKGSLEAYAIPQIVTPLATALGFGLCYLPQIVLVLGVLGCFALLSVICTSLYKVKGEDYFASDS